MALKVFWQGLFRNNPTFRLVLGLCPTLAVTTSLENGLGMGLAATFVLCCSNGLVSALRKAIPSAVRIPCYIVIIATFVTVLQMLLAAYVPEVNASLGIFIPLIVVNCIILGRAESFASKHGPIESIFDGIGIGLGFAFALTLLGGCREFLGTGKIFDLTVFPEDFGALMFVLPPGAFITLGFLTAIVNKIRGVKN